ncbi:MAG: rhodanese-like domain-containing protein [Acidobacteria bacterium]|nr:rhodanese-like domain-containing protein [Acidobacteriota bacterium]
MAVKSISPQEAHDWTGQDEGTLYLDVRTVEEFSEGHPAKARNVPLLHRDPSGRMAPNPDFLAVVKANFPSEARLLVGCLSGGRSLKAAEILEAAGYTQVVNVRCGFGGARDAAGRIVEPGWAGLGLPVEREARQGASYEALKGKVRP